MSFFSQINAKMSIKMFQILIMMCSQYEKYKKMSLTLSQSQSSFIIWMNLNGGVYQRAAFIRGNTVRAAQRILRPWGKRERRSPLQAKRAENFQSLQINFGKLLLVYFMRPPDLESLGAMRSLGPYGPGEICPLSPPSRWSWIVYACTETLAYAT